MPKFVIRAMVCMSAESQKPFGLLGLNAPADSLRIRRLKRFFVRDLAGFGLPFLVLVATLVLVVTKSQSCGTMRAMVFEQLKNLALYCVAHAALILVITEGIKRSAAAFGAAVAKPVKILIPATLGLSSIFVGPFAIRALGLESAVCAVPDACGQETAWVILLWWGASVSGAIGLYHLIPLFSTEIVQAIKNRIGRI